MLRIGDFSKVCQVSVKALRYWDECDLLKPAQIDSDSGYRYYTIEQVSAVNRILAFRVMGLEIKQIKQLLDDDLQPQDIRAMLRLKQAELQQQIENMTATLTVVESRLKQIECEGELPDYDVTLKPVEPLNVLCLRETVPTMRDLVALLHETHGYAKARTGTNLLAVFHDPAYHEEAMDVEIGFPVEGESVKPLPISQARSMQFARLPGVKLIASTVHNGTWDTLSDGYVHLGKWIDSNGYHIVGAGREIFHHIDWENAHKTTVTELQFPVARHSS